MATEMQQLLASLNTLITKLDERPEGNVAAGGHGLSAEEKAVVVRKAKWENILHALRKGRVKDFVPGNYIKKHIESVEEECAIQCRCYDLKYTDLTESEKVLLLRLKLPHEVVSELIGCCEQEGTTIDTIEYAKFRKMVIKVCGVVTPLVNIVMQYFGPDRLIQGKDESMLTHNVKFMNNLDPCMTPTDDDGRIGFVYLIQRSAYFGSVRHPEVQKALSEVPESEVSLKKV